MRRYWAKKAPAATASVDPAPTPPPPQPETEAENAAPATVSDELDAMICDAPVDSTDAPSVSDFERDEPASGVQDAPRVKSESALTASSGRYGDIGARLRAIACDKYVKAVRDENCVYLARELDEQVRHSMFPFDLFTPCSHLTYLCHVPV